MSHTSKEKPCTELDQWIDLVICTSDLQRFRENIATCKNWCMSSWQSDQSIFQRILEVFTFELYTLPVLSSTRKPRQVLIFNFKIKKDQKRRCCFIIWSNDNQSLHKSHTFDTDVTFLPAIIPVPPPGHFPPDTGPSFHLHSDTGPSFRWCRGVCCSSTLYLGSSASCGASDAPGNLSLLHA